MTSNLQIEANRRNARPSTGPKAVVSRRISSMNALKHGLTARHATVFDETVEDLQAFHGELMTALRPKGAPGVRSRGAGAPLSLALTPRLQDRNGFVSANA